MIPYSHDLFNGIIGWQKTSFIDYKRTVATVLFFSGCNLRCPYCHNSDIVYKKLPQINADELNNYLIQKRKIIDGVVITGGEPSLHKNLNNLILYLKSLGYKIKLDTNGLLPDALSLVINNIDYLAIDVKTSPILYKNKLLAVYDDCDQRLGQTINLVDMSHLDFEIRITTSKSLTTENDVHSIGRLIKNIRGKVYLQKLNKYAKTLDPNFNEETLDDETLESYKSILLKYVKYCEIRK